jgi:hypothetical protein
MDISGHPPIPLVQNMGFHLGSFSTIFRVLNFRGRFEALNEVFWARQWPYSIHVHGLGPEWNMYSSYRPFQL